MTREHGEFGTGILCSREGRLTAVLRDDLGLCRRLGPEIAAAGENLGIALDRLVDRAEVHKCRQFLAELNAHGAAFDWAMNARLASGVTPVHFAGSTLGDRLLIAAARSRSNLARLHGDLLRSGGADGGPLRNPVAHPPGDLRAGLVAADAPGSDRDEDWLFDELTRLNNELANLQRELAKSNAELAIRNRELARINRHQAEFMRAFGHETRTPLNAILSLARLLELGVDGALEPGQRLQVALIRESAEHMLKLVDDLLDLSKVEAGVVAVRQEPVRVEDLLASAANTVLALAEEKGLVMQVAVAPGLPPVHTDFLLCQRVLLNLLGNAVKFTDRGEITLAAARAVRRDGEAFLQVDVTDTGIGIPADKLDAVFEEFTQVHSDVDGPGGSGLGLTITRRILAILGGEIRVQSTLGKGSRFSFTLPFGGPTNRQSNAPSGTAPGLPTGNQV